MAVLRYSLIRLGLFAAAFAVLVTAGLNLWMAPVVAAFVAWGLSYVLLARFRDAAAAELAQRAQRRAARGEQVQLRGRAREDADLEDEQDEALRAGGAGQGPGGLDESTGSTAGSIDSTPSTGPAASTDLASVGGRGPDAAVEVGPPDGVTDAAAPVLDAPAQSDSPSPSSSAKTSSS